MGNSESVPSSAQTAKLSPLLFTPLEPRLTPVGLSSEHVYQTQVTMRLLRSAVVFISETAAKEELEAEEENEPNNAAEADEEVAVNTAEPLAPGVVYRFNNHLEKMRWVKTIVNSKRHPIVTLIPKGLKHEYTIYNGEQTVANLDPATEPVGSVRCKKFGSGMDAHITFKNFGEGGESLKFIVSSESSWGNVCVVRFAGDPIGYIVRRRLSYYFTVTAGVDVTLFIALIAAIEKARPKG
ncbi:hypothetical protein DL93DRAFT_1307569 [Clavulina sp. PMI_390]|nr:hypothetical protein DL93DRAFT_1307569 [Clavulina sp. PMI_390]